MATVAELFTDTEVAVWAKSTNSAKGSSE